MKEIEFAASKPFAYLLFTRFFSAGAGLSPEFYNAKRGLRRYLTRSLKTLRSDIASLRCDGILFKQDSLQIGDFMRQTLRECLRTLLVERRAVGCSRKERFP